MILNFYRQPFHTVCNPGPTKRFILKTPAEFGKTHYVTISPALSGITLTEFTFCAAVYADKLTSEHNGCWFFSYSKLLDDGNFNDNLAFGFVNGRMEYKIATVGKKKFEVRQVLSQVFTFLRNVLDM